MLGLSRTKELVIRGGSRFPPHLSAPGTVSPQNASAAAVP